MKRKHGGTVYAEITVVREGIYGLTYDVEVEVSGYYTPEQNGGMTDPSWSAYVTFESAEVDGKPFTMTKDDIDHAEQVMLEKAHGQD